MQFFRMISGLNKIVSQILAHPINFLVVELSVTLFSENPKNGA